MTPLLRWPLYLLGLIFTTWLIWYWNRGAQRRRFNRAYPTTPHAWSDEMLPFLSGFEDAFRLPRGWAKRVPLTASPMDIYLTLYPEHCIYDANETLRLTKLLHDRGVTLPDTFLSLPLSDLAQRYLHATHS